MENTPPSAVANTQVEAILSLMGYADIVEGAINDRTRSPEELVAIAQAGVNATASLNSVNVSQLMGLAKRCQQGESGLAMRRHQRRRRRVAGTQGQHPQFAGQRPQRAERECYLLV
ncbi:MAG: hypothetical protein R2873_35840 [Caldilineaceae bacterium]